MPSKDAKAKLKLARKQQAKAQKYPDDEELVFLWCFYALENAISAAAIQAKVHFEKSHWSREKAARALARQYGLTDVGNLLSDLNEARKETAYGESGEIDLDVADVLQQVTDYVQEVSRFLAE